MSLLETINHFRGNDSQVLLWQIVCSGYKAGIQNIIKFRFSLLYRICLLRCHVIQYEYFSVWEYHKKCMPVHYYSTLYNHRMISHLPIAFVTEYFLSLFQCNPDWEIVCARLEKISKGSIDLKSISDMFCTLDTTTTMKVNFTFWDKMNIFRIKRVFPEYLRLVPHKLVF